MESDRELLELAARAEGHAYPWVVPARGGERPWNPLADDGDALRLAVKLGMTIDPSECSKSVFAGSATSGARGFADEPMGGSPCAATRRAIVRAAAEIGRGMD